MAISEARKKANKKWDDNNKERMKYLRYRSYSRTFINKLATLEDLKNLQKTIKNRINEMK
ncbi:hypothetical protein Q3C15_00935 [Ligilactobacillus sp. 110_WCHN]|nr:hypothetical protein [Ligilactobacillus sp. 110_WCHN]MDO3392597.1 hypothetical protein [Ligilactobacillus sp. 110_WCHN]